MKACKQPKAERIQPGMVFYSCSSYHDEEKDTVSVEIDEWHVRSVKAKRGSKSRYGIKHQGIHATLADTSKYVNLTRKTPFTWVKRSRKHFDYGWAKSISEYDRSQFKLGGDNLPRGIYTTPLQAAKYEISTLKSCIAWSDKWLKENAETADPEYVTEEKRDLAIYERMLKAVERRMKKLSS